MTPAVDDVDPRQWIAQQMHALGHDALVEASEEEPASVWVEEDRAPEFKPGYYVAKRIAAPHSLTFTETTATLRFAVRHILYTMSCSKGVSPEASLRILVGVFRALLSFIELGVMTWDDAFGGFVQSESWWQVLRLPPDATSEEINDGYRRLVAKHHPDVDGGTHEGFLRIQQAYDIAKETRT